MERKIRVTNKIRFSVFLLLISFISTLLLLYSLEAITVYASEKTKTYETINVEEGDTVWSIAADHIDQSHYDDLRYYCYIIALENNLDDYIIVEGQSLKLPVKNKIP